MTPSLLNNSLIVGTRDFRIGAFTDQNSLFQLYKKEPFTTYKGMIALFNQRKLMNTPLLNMTELSNSVTYVNGAEGRFRYSLPYDLDLPYAVEDLTGDNQKPGIDGQRFKIKLSEKAFTNTDIITYDWRDGVPLYITEEEIYEEAGGYVFTVMIPQTNSNRTKWFPKDKLSGGVQYMKITNVNGEFDTQKSSISHGSGAMDLEVQMGGHRSVYHWITGYANMLKIQGKDGALHPYNSLEQYTNMKSSKSTLVIGMKDAEGKMVPQNVRWMKMIEAMLFAEMKMMEERDLMWSKGGYVEGSGRTKVRVNLGLYEQLRNGNRYEYTKLTLGLIESAVNNLFYNSGVPFEQRRTEIQVGTAAMIEVSKLLEEDFRQSYPFLVTASDIKGSIYGGPMDLGYGLRFTSKRFPVAGQITFVLNPALDNTYNRTQDQRNGHFPIESHTLMILDVTDGNVTNIAAKAKSEARVEDGFNSGSNIVLIKPEGYEALAWGYEQGTESPFGASGNQGLISSSQRHGYAIWMQAFSSIWLKDATRTMILEKRREY